jgi:peptide deformylase
MSDAITTTTARDNNVSPTTICDAGKAASSSSSSSTVIVNATSLISPSVSSTSNSNHNHEEQLFSDAPGSTDDQTPPISNLEKLISDPSTPDTIRQAAQTLAKQQRQRNEKTATQSRTDANRTTTSTVTSSDAVDVVHAAVQTIERLNANASRSEQDAVAARTELERLRRQPVITASSSGGGIGWRSIVLLIAITALLYLAAAAMIAPNTGLDTSTASSLPSLRLVNPHDHSRVVQSRFEDELGSFLASGSDNSGSTASTESSNRRLLSARRLLWPLQLIARRLGNGNAEEDTKHAREKNAIVIYPLVDSIGAEECLMVTPDEVQLGRVLGGSIPLVELRTSLLYHLASKRITAACAQHIGVPVCYCILDMRRHEGSSKHPSTSLPAHMRNFVDLFQPGDYLELFNPKIIGFSRNRIMQVQERNVFCKKTYFTKRFEAVTVEFLDNEGRVWERDFHGIHAFNLQHVAEVHRGMRSCLDDSADLLVQLIRGRIGGSGERSAFERAMLFADPDSFRNQRPSAPLPKVASPTPALLLEDASLSSPSSVRGGSSSSGGGGGDREDEKKK